MPHPTRLSFFSVVDGAVRPVGDVDLDAAEAAELLEVVERSAERLRPRLAVLTAPEGVGHLEQPQLAQPRPGVVLEGLADAVVAVGVLQLAGVQGQSSAGVRSATTSISFLKRLHDSRNRFE